MSDREQVQRKAAGNDRLFAIVLAAGAGVRYGGIKQLARFEGVPLVTRSVRLCERACGPRSVLVVGYEWQSVVDACRPLQGFFVNNVSYRDGIGSSIARGVKSVRQAADAVLLMLADQPLVTLDHLRRLIAARADDAIAVTTFAGTEGPPVIFPARCFGELSILEGDEGARKVLKGFGGRIVRVAFEPAGVDIDAPRDLEDLENLRESGKGEA